MSAAVQRAVELRCFSFLRALLGTPAFARDAQRPLFVGLADELVVKFSVYMLWVGDVYRQPAIFTMRYLSNRRRRALEARRSFHLPRRN